MARLPENVTRKDVLPDHVIEMKDLTEMERRTVRGIVRAAELHRLTAIDNLRDLWDIPRRQAEMLVDEAFAELAAEGVK